MSLDEHVAEMDRRLRALSLAQASLFYACCAERFFPLYTAFSRAERWGDTKEVRNHLDLAWESALRQHLDREVAQTALDGLLRQTPHADDFESVETTFAQDECLLISSALGCAADITDENAIPVDGAFEILRVAHCVESTGFLDLGDDPQAAMTLADFTSSESFLQEVGFQDEDLREILAATKIDNELVSRLRNRAVRNQYSAIRLLPTQAARESP
ncbi:DUF416 family protein [Paraliomyxa miuraensis]|uniref:DUF416 family protein n=1 Tax=Paraliomyxa miuraensis TaxID=376150 RepID=UPI0022568461|nr:DUF416 family protein [Paraliomyxa miuraensis]MCX4246604.1 YjaG family protein [Paraliomyxa miuraensis]